VGIVNILNVELEFASTFICTVLSVCFFSFFDSWAFVLPKVFAKNFFAYCDFWMAQIVFFFKTRRTFLPYGYFHFRLQLYC